MSPFFEFEGKNLEQAVTKACEALGIPRDKLKHEVVSFGATGIFGLVGIKKARIRVTAPGTRAETATPAPLESSLPKALPSADDIRVRKNTAVHQRSQDVETGDSLALQPSMRENLTALGRQVLQRLVDSVTSGAEIAVSLDGSRHIVYTISGGDPAEVIGKNGQTLEAIEYLLKKIISKFSEDRIRIVVNIAGHTLKRQNDLQLLASRFAEKACRNGKCVTIGRFSPRDRKIIHMALKNDRRVKTQSKGEGYLKKLVVIPRGE